jgi:hypothetical protein
MLHSHRPRKSEMLSFLARLPGKMSDSLGICAMKLYKKVAVRRQEAYLAFFPLRCGTLTSPSHRFRRRNVLLITSGHLEVMLSARDLVQECTKKQYPAIDSHFFDCYFHCRVGFELQCVLNKMLVVVFREKGQCGRDLTSN